MFCDILAVGGILSARSMLLYSLEIPSNAYTYSIVTIMSLSIAYFALFITAIHALQNIGVASYYLEMVGLSSRDTAAWYSRFRGDNQSTPMLNAFQGRSHTISSTSSRIESVPRSVSV
jgi:hypothetical protein